MWFKKTLKGCPMNRAELIEEVAKVTSTKKEADESISAMLAAIKKALKKGESVTLVGFGTFSVSKRKARKGRNPQTGEVIKIAAKKVPVFKAGKGLKDAVKSFVFLLHAKRPIRFENGSAFLPLQKVVSLFVQCFNSVH
jgi:DNA-binding protein HU-beta